MACQLASFVVLSVFLSTTWGSALRTAKKNVGIYGGDPVSIQDNPYMAALFEEFGGLEFLCGGSIIHKRFILTAAHCFTTVDAEDAKVLVGTDDLGEKDGVYIDVEKKICHKEFIRTEDLDDICLLKLKEPIVYSDKVKKVTLPEKDFELDAGVLVNITGWGATDAFQDTKLLRQTTIPIESQDSCRKVYEDLTDKEVCAGSPGHDACWGDSGSPLTHNGIQIGIVSYGNGCGRFSTVYTRVSSYLDWINTTIAENV